MKTSDKKLLILTANPEPGGEHGHLRIDDEVRCINNSLAKSAYTPNHHPSVRIGDLPNLFRTHQPHLIHFSGHGVEEGLYFQDDNGQLLLADPDGLAKLFGLFKPAIECVVLNACYTERQAEAIACHVPYVVAMSKAVGDQAAIDFAKGFYDSLAAGDDYRRAFDFGCSHIQFDPNHRTDHHTPVLLGAGAVQKPTGMNRPTFLQEVASLLKAGKLAVCIGPAFSEAAELPRWREIFRGLGCASDELNAAENDYPAFASQLVENKRHTATKIRSFVAEQLDAATVHLGTLHDALKALPFSLILTSNYDQHLEDLWGRSRLRIVAGNEGANHLESDDAKLRLVYLLGNMEQPDQMLVGNDELQEWRHLCPKQRAALKSRLSGQRLLFLGYRASDPLLSALKDLLPIAPEGHYAALLGGTTASSGIHTLAVADHAQLAALLEELHRVAGGAEPTPVPAEAMAESIVELAADAVSRIRLGSITSGEIIGFDALPMRGPTYLPRRIERFTGRETELQDILAALKQGGPVGITGLMGMGGIGKTSLAIEISHHCRDTGLFPDGVCWHTLGDKGFSTSLEELGSELGMDWLARMEGMATRKSAFRSALGGRRLLFVLDDANYPQRLPDLLDLLAGHPVLVTSRANLSGLTRAFTVARLKEEAARRLFLKTWLSLTDDDAANAVLDKQNRADHAAMDGICLELLGCLPLAISLAASLAGRRHWTLAKLQSELAQKRLALLNDPKRVDQREAKDRDVRLSFDLSYQLLEEETTRLVLDVTGVFGSEAFTPAALAEAAGLDAETTEAALADLADLSFVDRDEDGRVRLHPLTREYAIEQLASRGDQAPWARMVHHYVELVRSNPKALAYDWRNALHAVQWCFEHGQYEDGLFLMGKVDWFLYKTGRWTVREGWLKTAVDIAQDSESPENIYRFKLWQSDQWDRQGHYNSALVAYQELRELCLRHPDLADRVGWCDYVLAALQRKLNSPAHALVLDQANLRRLLRAKDWYVIGAACRNIGNAYFRLSRLDQVLGCFTANWEIEACLQNGSNLSRAFGDLFNCFLNQGNANQAHITLQEMRNAQDAHPHRETEGEYQNHAFHLALGEDRLADAERALESYTAIARELGALNSIADSAYYSGLLRHAQSLPVEARTSLEQALTQYREHGFLSDEVPCLRWLGLLAARRGDYRQARTWLDEARVRAESHGGPEDLARWETAYALLQARSGFSFDAVRGLRRALNSYTALGIGDLREEQRIEEEIRTLLGEDYSRAEARLRADGLEGETVDLREEAATLEPAEHTIVSPVDGREMLLIPSGLVRAEHHEHPFFLYPFYIDRYPVTHHEYRHYLEAMNLPAPPHWPEGRIPAGQEARPVVGITWDEARGYAEWCGKKLPLAEEWEVAAGLREGRETPWGVEWDEKSQEALLSNMGFQPVDFCLAGDHRAVRHWSRVPSLISIHPLTEFNEETFLQLLFASLSLSVSEKKRVIDAIPTLSQFQIDELTKVFSDELAEFNALWEKETETILNLQKRCLQGLAELEQTYLLEHAAHADIKEAIAFHAPLLALDDTSGHAFFSAELAEWCDAPLPVDDGRGYSDHQCKGGGWFFGSAESLRLAASAARDPYRRTLDTGFRCVLPVFDKGAVANFLKEQHGVDARSADEQAAWFLRRVEHLSMRPRRDKRGAQLRTSEETNIALDYCRRALHLANHNPRAVELFLELKAELDASLATLGEILKELDVFHPSASVQTAWKAALAAETVRDDDGEQAFEDALGDLLVALEAELPGNPVFTHSALPKPTPPRFRERTTQTSQEYFLALHRDQIPFPLLGPLLAAWRVLRELKREKPIEPENLPDEILQTPTDDELKS
ncbi:MAG: SUMF1/EgtB/PvdO family nonheme iron enzyme [Sulfuricella sp.]|nr:SUMF1/EgtB/PvdO family nonheme iron enzyme [Sulfuricella sp.]